MVERIALQNGKISEEYIKLYEAWAKGGIAMSITGNIMVDRRALSDTNEPVVEDESDLINLRRVAELGKRYGVLHIAQISHPGKQCPKGMNKKNVAPSAVGFSNKQLNQVFGIPRALTEDEIKDVIKRFGETARILEKAGFGGVELHGAHGYLINQFLSPAHNQRRDQWGGPLVNRMRFLVACYEAVRANTSEDFIVGVKLNSADFQLGGFTEDESVTVYKTLDQMGVDFMEVSGGTYESADMLGVGNKKKKESTIAREAYFLEFAERVRKEVKTKLILTGGFRTPSAMNAALVSEACDLIGIARPLAMDPNIAKAYLRGEHGIPVPDQIKTGIGLLDKTAALEIPWYAAQFRAIAKGGSANPDLSPMLVLLQLILGSIGASIRTAFRG